jgi:hypothetical protein
MRDHEIRMKVEMPCATLQLKNIEREQLKSQLDEWLGAGNKIDTLPSWKRADAKDAKQTNTNLFVPGVCSMTSAATAKSRKRGGDKIAAAKAQAGSERKKAQIAGLMFYEGSACKSGHTKRRTGTGTCVECDRIGNKARRQAKRAESSK